jgi:hypothetical protein
MSFVTIPQRLASLASVTAAAANAAFSAVADVLNGNLTYANFKRRMKIPNSMKESHYSLVCIRAVLTMPAAGNTGLQIINLPNIPGATLVRWQGHALVNRSQDAGVTYTYDGTVTGSCAIGTYIDGSGPGTTWGTAPLVAASGKLFDGSLSQALAPTDRCYVSISPTSFNAGTGHTNTEVIFDLWLKVPHQA